MYCSTFVCVQASKCASTCKYISLDLFSLLSRTAVVEFASPKLQVSAVRGQDITLPTELVFTGSGNCSVRPIVGSVRLVFNEVTRVLCNYNMDCSTKTEALYNFATFGDITIPSSAAEEGVYMLGVEVSCIGQSLPQRDYNVTFTSPSTSCKSASQTKIVNAHACMYCRYFQIAF